MGKKRRTVESIVAMLREAEVQMAKGQPLVREARIAEGDVLMSKLHDDKDALSAFQGVLMTDGSSHEAKLKEAMCYERLGRKSEASAVFDSLVQAGGADAGAAKFLLKSIASDTTAEGGPCCLKKKCNRKS